MGGHDPAQAWHSHPAAVDKTTVRATGSWTGKEDTDGMGKRGGTEIPVGDSKRSKTNDDTRMEAWPEATHRLFVETIYDIGVKNASPSVILESMTANHNAVTSERVKSHLQKYRNNRKKSKQEFLAEYDSWMQKALTVGAASTNELVSPRTIVSMVGSDGLLGGELAAFLAYTAMFEESCEINGHPQPAEVRTGELPKYLTGARVPFPILSEEERKSPLGISISHVISLFYSMTTFLMQEREMKKQGTIPRTMGSSEESKEDDEPIKFDAGVHVSLPENSAAPRTAELNRFAESYANYLLAQEFTPPPLDMSMIPVNPNSKPAYDSSNPMFLYSHELALNATLPPGYFMHRNEPNP